jgi:hypothetical protein
MRPRSRHALADLKSRIAARRQRPRRVDQLRTIRIVDHASSPAGCTNSSTSCRVPIVITNRLSAAFFGHKPAGESRQNADAAWPLAPLPQIPS